MIYNPVTEDQVIIDKKYMPSMRAVHFKSGGCKLLGSIYLTGSKDKVPTVVLTHGFPGNEHNQDLAHAVRRAGYNVFIFHYRGSWGSEGEFSFNNAIEDIVNAYDFIKADDTCERYNLDKNKIVFIGHSMGGFAIFLNSARLLGVNNLGFLAGFNFGVLPDIAKLPFAKEKILEHLSNGAAMVKGTNAELLFEEIKENKKKFNLLNYVEDLNQKNLLIVGAKYDSTSMISLHHKPLVKALKRHKSLKEIIVNSGHVFSTKRIELAHIIVEWLNEINFNGKDAD